MNRAALGVLATLLVCALPPCPASSQPTAATGPARPAGLSAEALAAEIDDLIAARWRKEAVQPAAASEDTEFLRRLALDLTGRIPSVYEVRRFLDDPSPHKRRDAVERLLASPGHVRHFAATWRALLLPQSNTPQSQALAPDLEAWLRKRLRDNVGYDRLARELLTARPAIRRPATLDGAPEPTPQAFYTALEMKPENLAAATSRILLGVKLECAQCHDHPFDRWTREQFWEYAAFFSPLSRAAPANVAASLDEPRTRELRIPGTDKTVQARFLTGDVSAWSDGGTRQTLADWVAAPDNPYFARATVNRLWHHFFGLGLVDPVDEFADKNPPSHPELLDLLAREFARHEFDVRFLIRAITLSKTYQLSSAGDGPAPDPRLFARMAVKGLTAEQVFDSLVQATGLRVAVTPAMPNPVLAATDARAEFLARFANLSDRRTEYQTSILQALALMNGRLVADATSLERGETLAAVQDAPFLDTAAKVDTLFLAALGRLPRSDERDRFVRHVEQGGPRGDPRRALADVFWTLLNTSEFVYNH